MIDLRSDTVTQPTAGMRKAMMDAPVGDDVFGDDPTVNRLQAIAAERAGKEAGLFLPTGTQSNLAGLMAHCERGDEYIVGQNAHTYKYEGGGAAVLGSIQPQPLANAADGSIPLDLIAAAIKPDDTHFAKTKLLALENTIGGKVLPAGYVADATSFAKSKGLGTHLDGARIWNVMAASNAPLAELCAGFDSVSMCFSKGMGAPVGSVLVGSKELIKRAARWRKTLGGGMRQAGVLAAACLYALDNHLTRLRTDHENAAKLAKGLSDIPALKITSQSTNMVFVAVPDKDCAPLAAFLKERGILTLMSPNLRLVTHGDVTDPDMGTAIAAFKAYYTMK
ncbi:MAG: low-specificity L-threonine aldolase [Rhodospirillaceae bacterium]